LGFGWKKEVAKNVFGNNSTWVHFGVLGHGMLRKVLIESFPNHFSKRVFVQ
jgi:hypothetical protein